MRKLYLATSNQDKLREFQEILDFSMEWIKIDLDEIQAVKIKDLIEHKARQAYQKTKKNVLVEDTALEIDVWHGLPGALYKWFYKTVGNAGICKMMKTQRKRGAKAITVVGFYDGKKMHVFSGEIKGSIALQPRGKFGFGWDMIFVPQGHRQTFAELGPEIKNKISMRKKALVKLRGYLKH